MHKKVRRLSKGRSLASFWGTRDAPEISGSTFQWHRRDCKPCLPVWHTQPAQWTQSIYHFGGEGQLCLSQQIKWLHWMPNWNYGGNKLTLGFWHISDINKDFARDWARAFFILAGVWSPISAFERVWALLPNHETVLNWKGMDLWSIYK